MIRITGLGVKNLRSLKRLDNITLKPLTILVGRNSAGKSTFARLLPLLKQSSEKRKQSPILWWGRLVDFGTFDDVYSSLSQDGYIDITVVFETTDLLFFFRSPYWREPDLRLSEPASVESTFRLGKNDDGNTVLKELHLKAFGVSVALTLTSGTVSAVALGGRSIEIPPNVRLIWTQGTLMPLIRSVNMAPTPQTAVSDESLFGPRRFARFGMVRAKAAVSQFLHGNTQEDRKEEIVDRLPLGPLDDFFQYCKTFPNATVTWKSSFEHKYPSHWAVRELHASVLLYKLDMLMYALDEAAQRHLAEVSYLEPLRATAQRYYRREEISTDELDPKGLNVPFFIQGLNIRERESLNAWTKANFGFSLSVSSSGGHVSLNILPEGNEGGVSRNMADVGLGYSQLVPVALQLWAARHRVTDVQRRTPAQRRTLLAVGRTVVVEQPELHLHPAYQARIADVFAASIQLSSEDKTGVPLTIVAETHSSNLISRLGELITSGSLSAEAVQILVFEDSEERGEGTSVRVATFDDEGVLKNWPIGFFDA